MRDFPPTPETLSRYCRTENKKRCFMGTAPTLAAVSEAYGEDPATVWIYSLIANLSEYSGVKEKADTEQADLLSQVLLDKFRPLKVTEVMYFFWQYTSGKHGVFFGAVDCMAIANRAEDFLEEREKTVNRYCLENKLAREKAEAEAEDRKWERLSRRYRTRVPDADTDSAPLTYLQYQFLDCDTMTDGELERLVADVRAGRQSFPRDTTGLHAIWARRHESGAAPPPENGTGVERNA